MRTNIETLAYLGPKASFSHELALHIQANSSGMEIELVPTRTIAEVCDLVVNGKATRGVLPVENSTDGPVIDGLTALRQLPLHIDSEYVNPIRPSLFYHSDIKLTDIKFVTSKDSALGQCRRNIKEFLPWASVEPRSSTVAAVLEAAENPHMAAIGPKLTAREHNLTHILAQTDNFHDDPLNATRFFIVDQMPCDGKETNPITGNDKTSLIVQMSDKPDSLHTALVVIAGQKINLAKIKSFGRNAENVSFLMTLQGHQYEPSLTNALNELSSQGIRIKTLGSYQQADYQLPEVVRESNIQFASERLRTEILNGVENKTVAIFTLKDEIGSLKNALGAFQNINLLEIDSLPTGKLGEYIFYLAFEKETKGQALAIKELEEHCTRLVLI